MESIAQISNIFSAGLGDLFLMPKIIPILINNTDVLVETIRILGSNFAMLLGSIAAFKYIISPSVAHIQGTLGVDEEDFQLISTCFHLLWVVPIYILCYLSSLAWYQNLADLTYRHIHGSAPKDVSVKVALTQTVYSTLVWVFIFVEVQVITNLLPPLFQYISEIIVLNVYENNPLVSSTEVMEILMKRILFQSISSNSIGIEDIEISYIQWGVFLCLIIPLKLLSTGSFLLGCGGCSLLYGWYGFDYYWNLLGYDCDKRIQILEKNYLYFVGFGTPLTIVMKYFDFFMGYGLYLTLFPFIIILCTITDYERSISPFVSIEADDRHTVIIDGTTPREDKNNIDLKSKTKATSSVSNTTFKMMKNDYTYLPIFHLSKKYSVLLLKEIDKYIRLEVNKK